MPAIGHSILAAYSDANQYVFFATHFKGHKLLHETTSALLDINSALFQERKASYLSFLQGI